MSSKILEIEEKTIDGAIEKACRDFGVPREKLNIEIISEGSSGFLGLMAKKAKIRASLLSFDMNFSLNSTTSAPVLNESKPRKSSFQNRKTVRRKRQKPIPKRNRKKSGKQNRKTGAGPNTLHRQSPVSWRRQLPEKAQKEKLPHLQHRLRQPPLPP